MPARLLWLNEMQEEENSKSAGQEMIVIGLGIPDGRAPQPSWVSFLPRSLEIKDGELLKRYAEKA